MDNIFAFVSGNWESIIAVLIALHGAALAIANLTPTPEDNKWVGRFYRVIEILAGITTRKAKELPGESKDIELDPLY